MRSPECYFGVYFPRCCATREINTKITLEWAHKQFATRVHTLFYMFYRHRFFLRSREPVLPHHTTPPHLPGDFWSKVCTLSLFASRTACKNSVPVCDVIVNCIPSHKLSPLMKMLDFLIEIKYDDRTNLLRSCTKCDTKTIVQRIMTICTYHHIQAMHILTSSCLSVPISLHKDRFKKYDKNCSLQIGTFAFINCLILIIAQRAWAW